VAKRRGPLGYHRIKERGRGAIDLVVAYVKQETVNPLRDLGRFVAYGTIGSFFLAIALVLGLMAVLRALQEETGAFHGNLSWIPYLIVAILGVGVIAIAAWRIISGPAKRRLPPKEPT
jgi:amino acid transporter